MLKIGIIGLGKMGLIRLQSIREAGYGEVVIAYDPKDNSTEVPRAYSPEEVIENPDIDVVFICTPNHLNKPLTIFALQSGKHVFCEKPPAFTADEVREIQRAEQASGKTLMYGFNHRHHDSVKKIKALIDSQEFGRILWLRGRYGKSVDSSFYDNWRSKKELSGGGILIDQGIHMLDLFVYLAGNFDQVHAAISNLYWNIEVEDNVFATLQNTQTGLVASLHSTMCQWRHLFSLEIFFERGYAVLNGLKTSSNSYGDEVLSIARNSSGTPAATRDSEENFTYHVDSSWRSEIDEFFAAIQSKRRPKIGNSDDALNVMTLLDKIYSFAKV